MDPWEIQADLFESLHALRFAVLLALCVVFFSYIVRYRTSKDRDGFNAAIAFFIYTAGEAGWRGLVWYHHGDQVTSFDNWVMFSAAGLISAFGSIMCLKEMIPEVWRLKAWFVMIGCGIIVGIATLFV